MSENLGSININDLQLIQTDSDPSTGAGLEAEIGSIAFVNIAGYPFYQKIDSGDTDWLPMLSRSFVQFSNTQINQNLNSSTSNDFNTRVEILGNEIFINDRDFEKDGEEIICKFDGFVIAISNLHYWSTNSRTMCEARFKRNDDLIGPISACGYIRDSNGNQTSSSHIYTVIPVSLNDSIGIYTRRAGNSGSVYLDESGTSEFILVRF